MNTIRMRRASAVVAMIASTLVIATPAQADDFPPEISAFHRTSPDTLGGAGLVTLEFSATDQGPAGLAYAYFTYRGPRGETVRADSQWMDRRSEGTFVASELLSPWVATGIYTLEEVEVSDREWNSTIYKRSEAHGFDFAAADFSVTNPLEDTTTPTLTSATLFRDVVPQGTPVVILYSASDDLSGVEAVTFSGWSPTGDAYTVTSLPELGQAGPATWIVPLQEPSGGYESFEIGVRDRAGNHILYRPDGDRHRYPAGAVIPEHESPDPTTFDFTVVGSEGDRNAPALTGFDVLTPRERHLGDLVALDFEAADAGTGIEQVGAVWDDGRGHQINATKTCGDLAQGPISVEIEDYRSLGTTWTLEYIVLSDYLFNQSEYYRDGSVKYQGGDTGPTSHPFDLSKGDFSLEAGDPSPHELENTTANYCFRRVGVTLDVPDDDATYGDVIEASGELVDTGTLPAPPLLAVHEYVNGVAELTSVIEGERTGSFETSLIAQSNVDLTATFLGGAGARMEPATSERVHLSVGPKITAALRKERIRVGGRSRLYGTVSPAGQVGRLFLERWESGSWRTIREIIPDSYGAYSFSIQGKRRGTMKLRVSSHETERLSPGHSPPKVLRIRKR